MKELDAYLFSEQIKLFRQKLATSPQMEQYYKESKEKVAAELISTANAERKPIEQVLLTAICGEIRTRQQQAEFTTRLILLDLLTEQV